jgi:hypothetical protein
LTRRLSLIWLLAAIIGAGCAAAALAGPLPGVKTRADRAAWRSLLHWPASCERSWRSSGATGAGVELWRTRAGGHLVAVSCFLGAYQGTSMLYLLPARGGGRLLRLRLYVDTGDGIPRARTRTMILGNLAFHPSSGRLAVLDKWRGLGDCGVYSVFRLRRGAFRPVEARAKTSCNGKPPYDPTRWPKLPLP